MPQHRLPDLHLKQKFAIRVTFPTGIILLEGEKSHSLLCFSLEGGSAHTGRAAHVPLCLLLPPAAVPVALVVAARPLALLWAVVALAAPWAVAFPWATELAGVVSGALAWAVVLAGVVLAWALAAGLMVALTVVLAGKVRLAVALGATNLGRILEMEVSSPRNHWQEPTCGQESLPALNFHFSQ